MTGALFCTECEQRFTPRGGHCRGGQYGGCCRSFSGDSTFDKHRVGRHGVDRRCMTTQEMLDAGLRWVDGIWKGQPRDDDENE